MLTKGVMQQGIVRSRRQNGDNIMDDLVCQTLRGGIKIPKLAFWNSLSKNPTRDLESALSAGYRHIVLDPIHDRDDANVGPTISKWLNGKKLARDELFITLMFDLNQQRPLSSAHHRLIQRLHTLGCAYVDMVIIHKSEVLSIGDNLRQRNAFMTMWKGLEKVVTDKHARCLSLSNFRQSEVETIIGDCQIAPSALWFMESPEKLGWKDLSQAKAYGQYREMKTGVLPRFDRPEREWTRNVCPALLPVSKRLNHTSVQVFQRFHIQKDILVAAALDDRTIQSSFQVLDFCVPKQEMDQLRDLSL